MWRWFRTGRRKMGQVPILGVTLGPLVKRMSECTGTSLLRCIPLANLLIIWGGGGGGPQGGAQQRGGGGGNPQGGGGGLPPLPIEDYTNDINNKKKTK